MKAAQRKNKKRKQFVLLQRPPAVLKDSILPSTPNAPTQASRNHLPQYFDLQTAI